MAPEKITSAQNPKIKNLKKLEKASERREQGLILIEGLREVVLAVCAGYEMDTLFICDEIFKDQEQYKLRDILHLGSAIKHYQVSTEVYNTVAYRETTEGIIATTKPKEHSLKNIALGANPLILVIEAVEKPGNLGAMFRTADAAGVDAVIICDTKTDLYNPNVIRSSLGTIFTNQVATGNTKDVIHWLKQNNISIFAAELSGAEMYYTQDYKTGSAIVVGTEATGLSEEWINAADKRIKIPMLGEIDSLNVSVSAAVLLYEAVRQRRI